MIRCGTSWSSRRRPGPISAVGTGLRRCDGILMSGIAPLRRQFHPGRVGHRPVRSSQVYPSSVFGMAIPP
jgi:hypothetical protein